MFEQGETDRICEKLSQSHTHLLRFVLQYDKLTTNFIAQERKSCLDVKKPFSQFDATRRFRCELSKKSHDAARRILTRRDKTLQETRLRRRIFFLFSSR